MFLHIALAASLLASNRDVDAALADRRHIAAQDIPYTYYISLSSVPGDAREDLYKSLRFVLPSLSSKVDLGYQFPRKVNATLLRFDTRGLGWEHTLPKVLCERYPYFTHGHHYGKPPLVIDGLWLATNLIDPVETGTAHYELIYGKPPPDAGSFLHFWGIENNREFVFAQIEGKSGVANEGVRWMENRDGSKRNECWLTRDSAKIAGKTDPLENLPDRAKFDAQELIATGAKWYAGKSGLAQFYFLADGKGKRQEVAPASIVTDHTGIRGPEIRNGISCIVCHDNGLKDMTKDEYRAYIKSGARVFLDKQSQYEVDRYFGSDVAKAIQQGQKDYADFVQICNGMTPQDNAANLSALIRLYDGPVDIAAAARMACWPEQEVRFALGDYSRRFGLTGRLSLLAQGEPISRYQFIESWPKFQEVLYTWSAQFR